MKDAWDSIPAYMGQRSFLKCGISNDKVGYQDDVPYEYLLHYIIGTDIRDISSLLTEPDGVDYHGDQYDGRNDDFIRSILKV